MGFVLLNQTVDTVQNCRHFLNFINNVTFDLWVCGDDLFDSLGVGHVVSESPVVQQVDEVRVRKSFLSQVDFPVPLGPKIKKLSAGASKNLLKYLSLIDPFRSQYFNWNSKI